MALPAPVRSMGDPSWGLVSSQTAWGSLSAWGRGVRAAFHLLSRCRHPAPPGSHAADWTGAGAWGASGPCSQTPSSGRAWGGRPESCPAPAVCLEPGAWWGSGAGPRGRPWAHPPQPRQVHQGRGRLRPHPRLLLQVAAASAAEAARPWSPTAHPGPAWHSAPHTRRCLPRVHFGKLQGAACWSTADTGSSACGIVCLRPSNAAPNARAAGRLRMCCWGSGGRPALTDCRRRAPHPEPCLLVVLE